MSMIRKLEGGRGGWHDTRGTQPHKQLDISVAGHARTRLLSELRA